MAAETTNPVRTGAPAPGGVESLDALGMEAVRLEAPPPAAAAPGAASVEPQALPQVSGGDIAALLGMVRDMAGLLAEDAGWLKPGQTRVIWSDQALTGIAGPLGAVMQRHNVGLADVLERWGPYAMLAASVAVPASVTVRAVRENRAGRTVDEPKPEPAADGQQQPS